MLCQPWVPESAPTATYKGIQFDKARRRHSTLAMHPPPGEEAMAAITGCRHFVHQITFATATLVACTGSTIGGHSNTGATKIAEHRGLVEKEVVVACPGRSFRSFTINSTIVVMAAFRMVPTISLGTTDAPWRPLPGRQVEERDTFAADVQLAANTS